MKAIGALLKAAREAKGLSLEEIRMITKIRVQQLKALEEGEFDRLPGEVYVKGFLVNYARAVGLDGEEILKKYYECRQAQAEEETGTEEQAKTVALHSPNQVQLGSSAPLERVQGKPGKQLVVAGLAVVCILVAGLVWFSLHQTREPVAPESGPVAVTPLPGVTANEEPVAPNGDLPNTAAEPETVEPETLPPDTGPLLRVEAIEPVWLGVYEKATGQMIYEGTLYPPETREWLLSGDVTLRIGNAGGLRLIYKGQELGELGYSGQVITKEILLVE
ncbi:MAG: helix-turn-helix domain-containing protein [Firmicutes bacterium]|nr:helix-turn-helix domain-containing protein [Bacillota bacterium]